MAVAFFHVVIAGKTDHENAETNGKRKKLIQVRMPFWIER
jgi:hypothetical protein